MKAVQYQTYGPPDVLRVEEVEKPVPGENEVLIKIKAASVNPLDFHLMKGKPYFIRLFSGLRKPKRNRPGVDVAGQVEAAGPGVKQLKPGDEVFGSCRGAFAEYACAPESGLVIKPANVSFEQAASAPVASYTALQGLRDRGQIRPGQKVLINGAAGGVGTFAVQIAKSFGAVVTGVCSTKNLELVRSIGADHVVDYAQQDFTRAGERYDIIFDCVGNHPLRACRRVMAPQGVYVGVGAVGSQSTLLSFVAGAIGGLVLSQLGGQKFISFMAKGSQKDLAAISSLMASGKVIPVIDRSYKLSEVPEALRYLEAAHARGKVVITI